MSHKPTFIVCPHLTVYKDMGFDPKGAYGFSEAKINNCKCKLFWEGKPCKNRGNCIIAREDDTWKRISSKSFKEGE